MQSSLTKNSWKIQGETDTANVLIVKGDIPYEERYYLP